MIDFSAPKALEPVREMFQAWLSESEARGVTFAEGESIEFGWMRFEIRDAFVRGPTLGTMPIEWTPDISDCLNIVACQQYTCESFGLKSSHCRLVDSAICLNDWAASNSLYLNRNEPDGDADSGWYLSSLHSDLDPHNPSNFSRISLWEAACLRLEIAEFLLLPPQSEVKLEGTPTVFKDGNLLKAAASSYFAAKYRTNQHG